jgi:nucleotide-binding universal stress UspA family protein
VAAELIDTATGVSVRTGTVTAYTQPWAAGGLAGTSVCQRGDVGLCGQEPFASWNGRRRRSEWKWERVTALRSHHRAVAIGRCHPQERDLSTDAIATSNRVIVAVDGSPASLEALRVGHQMAALLGARLVGVTVWELFQHGVLPPESAHPEQFAEDLVANCLLAAFRGMQTPAAEILAIEGGPADSLIALSRETRLLVVGSRGHSGFPGSMLGSVSQACAAHAACPVLVVHAPEPALDESAPNLIVDQPMVVIP